MKLTFDASVDRLQPFTLNELDPALDRLIAAAQAELADKVARLSDGQSATWGFFPELNPNEGDYPACAALRRHFDEHFLSLTPLAPFEFTLAFIRLAASEPQSAFGGLHIDASAGIDHLPPKERRAGQGGILRVLINLYHEPRELQYAAEPIASLRAQGVNIPDDHYEIIRLPEDITLRSCFVPPRETGQIHGLMFDSAATLHAGRTNQKGHFLLSYGAYAGRANIAQLFSGNKLA